MAHKYRRHQDLSSLPFVSRVARLAEFIEKAFEAVVLFVQPGSLIITVQCPSLESLESLWNAYCSGYLNDVVESFLVTDQLKRKLGLDKVRLKTTIEEGNYLICKKAFIENLGELGILRRAFWGNMYFGLISFMEQFLFLYSLSNYDDDDDNDNAQKNWFYEQTNSSARASRFLVHFFDVHCTTTT